MKPSERRALEAEKRAQKEAEARERELQKKTSKTKKYSEYNAELGHNNEVESERVDTNAEYRKLPEEEIEVKGDGYHREGFFGSHIRLITFIITLTLVLTVLGPWGIDKLVSIKRNDYDGKDVTDKKNMTVAELIEIADKGVNLRWSDLDGFNYTDLSYNYKDEKTKKKATYYIRDYAVGEGLVLKVQGYSVSGAPGYAQLYLYKDDGSEYLPDIRTDDVEAFLKSNGYDY